VASCRPGIWCPDSYAVSVYRRRVHDVRLFRRPRATERTRSCTGTSRTKCRGRGVPVIRVGNIRLPISGKNQSRKYRLFPGATSVLALSRTLRPTVEKYTANRRITNGYFVRIRFCTTKEKLRKTNSVDRTRVRCFLWRIFLTLFVYLTKRRLFSRHAVWRPFPFSDGDLSIGVYRHRFEHKPSFIIYT